MRELSLLDFGYLAGAALLCLVLPLMMRFRGPLDTATRKSCMRTVWTGLTLGALAVVVVRLSAAFAPYAAGFGLVSCITYAFLLRRQFRAARTA